MAKQQILLVDADASSARLLEVSLRSAGFNVATAGSAESALGKLEHGVPDLIVTEARLPGVDGFAFVRQVRAKPELAAVPVVLLTEQGALEDKLRGLELGVDDYLAKPIMVREVVTRVQLLLARKKQERIASAPQARTRFSGSLEDVAVVDLLQTIAVSGKSGVASLKRGDREAWLYFDKGQVIDAEVGDLRGEEAVYRTITWTTGLFALEFRAIERARVIVAPYQALLMEGLRRVDELGRLAEQLPPETAILDIDHDALASRLSDIPDELNGILRLIDGKRTLLDLVDASPFDDLSTLKVLSKFYFEGLLLSSNPEPVEWAPGSHPASAARADSTPPPRSEPPGSTVWALPASPTSYPEETAATLVPPVRLPAPSTAPPPSDPPLEAHRQLTPGPAPPPAPVTARATAAPDIAAKVTPKGIVNVGDNAPPPPNAMPSPFRVANDAPRRSPIPMPAGSVPRSNGSANPGAGSSNGARESRTMYGLSATAPRQPQAPDGATRVTQPVTHPAATEVRGKAGAPAASEERTKTAERSPVPPAQREKDKAAAAVPQPSSRGEVPSGSPSSNPESEHEFFEAGDEGTYAGGPRSGIPRPLLGADVEEQPAPLVRGGSPSGHARMRRRSTRIVALALVVAAVPLIVAVWQKLASRSNDSSLAAPIALTADQASSSAVKQDGNIAAGVAPTVNDVSSVTASPSPALDPTQLGRDASAPVPPLDPLASPGEPSVQEPAGDAPAVAPAPAPAETGSKQPRAESSRPRAARNLNGAGPSPRPGLEAPPVGAPSKTAPAQGPEAARPGEKPPTAAYPLR